jgi:hypothetical protein
MVPSSPTMMRPAFFTGIRIAILSLCAGSSLAQSPGASPADRCGEVVTIETHERSTTRYAFISPPAPAPGATPITLALLPGGSGHVDLDDKGCPRMLKGNSLVRSIPLFGAEGFGTALIDAPSDYHGDEGLAGYRVEKAHAEDLGRVIADLRARTKGAVWLVGTSRGTISAVNVAARNTGAAAPDGLVLTSALMSGQSSLKKIWVAQTVFSLPLADIRLPLLIIGHAADTCVRSPPTLMEKLAAQTNGRPMQIVTVTGGPVYTGAAGVDACEGRSPHGYDGKEAEVAAGIANFIRRGKYQ